MYALLLTFGFARVLEHKPLCVSVSQDSNSGYLLWCCWHCALQFWPEWPIVYFQTHFPVVSQVSSAFLPWLPQESSWSVYYSSLPAPGTLASRVWVTVLFDKVQKVEGCSAVVDGSGPVLGPVSA